MTIDSRNIEWTPEAREIVDDMISIMRHVLEQATLARSHKTDFIEMDEDARVTTEKLLQIIEKSSLGQFLSEAIDRWGKRKKAELEKLKPLTWSIHNEEHADAYCPNGDRLKIHKKDEENGLEVFLVRSGSVFGKVISNYPLLSVQEAIDWVEEWRNEQGNSTQ